MISIKELFDWGCSQLIQAAVANSSSTDKAELKMDAAIDVRFLLCHFLDKPSTYLLTWPEKPVEASIEQQFKAAIDLRIAGKPIAYIVGYRDFWDLQLKVSEATLIPRADTELVVEQALSLFSSAPETILDLGTGTGAIALALASEFPEAKVTGSDRVTEAVDLAKENALLNKITNAQFIQGNWFEPVSGQQFDLIVSNPPYIAPQDPHLKQGDLRYEPVSALVSEKSGLADIEHLISRASAHLNDKAWLLLEHGYDQGAVLRELFKKAGYLSVQTRNDYGGNERITFGQKG